LVVRWAFLIPFICQLLKFQLFLLAQGFKVVVKAWGYAARNASVPGAALDWLDASLDTLSPYFNSDSIPQTIYLVVCVASMWLWAFGRNCCGWDGLD